MDDENNLDIPLGMVDVTNAINVLHIISHMIGNPKNRGGNDVLKRLQVLGFSDETSFYLLWFALCVIYQEVEDITGEALTVVQSLGGEIQDIFEHSESFPSFSEALRTVAFMEEENHFGDMKSSWKDHWKARYMKYWRKYLDSQDSSVPYFKHDRQGSND
jgi:hypothetical protein